MSILDGMFHLLAEVLQVVEFAHAGHHLSRKKSENDLKNNSCLKKYTFVNVTFFIMSQFFLNAKS